MDNVSNIHLFDMEIIPYKLTIKVAIEFVTEKNALKLLFLVLDSIFNMLISNSPGFCNCNDFLSCVVT